jgi:hypothetical protein
MSAFKPSSEAIEIALARVLSSAACRGRPSLRRLLTHLVQSSLADNVDSLKEYTLGVEVFGRGMRFDPQCDSNQTCIIPFGCRHARSSMAPDVG